MKEKKGVSDMSKSKSKLSIVIALTALLVIIFALVFPGVCLESQTMNPKDYTYIFGFTSIFGGTIVPKGSNLNCILAFNVGSFIALLLVLIAALLILIFDKQISSYVIGSILFIVSLVLFIFNERFVIETNGNIQGFSAYLYTGFGTYVSIGICSIGIIACLAGAYIIKADRSRHHHR